MDNDQRFQRFLCNNYKVITCSGSKKCTRLSKNKSALGGIPSPGREVHGCFILINATQNLTKNELDCNAFQTKECLGGKAFQI